MLTYKERSLCLKFIYNILCRREHFIYSLSILFWPMPSLASIRSWERYVLLAGGLVWNKAFRWVKEGKERGQVWKGISEDISPLPIMKHPQYPQEQEHSPPKNQTVTICSYIRVMNIVYEPAIPTHTITLFDHAMSRVRTHLTLTLHIPDRIHVQQQISAFLDLCHIRNFHIQ